MADPNATARGALSGPPLDVMVTVDGAPAAVVFSLTLIDPVTKQSRPFGPGDPIDGTLNHRYRVPGPTWWQNGKVVLCQVDGEPGAWTENRAHLRAFQGDQELQDPAWGVMKGDDPPGMPLALIFKLQ